MAILRIYHSSDPAVLLDHAARPFTALRARGRAELGTGVDLPLLAVRQGGIRDQIQEMAAISGASGWLGRPLVVFAELPELLAGRLAPLSMFERQALLRAEIERVKPQALAAAGGQRRLLDAIDATVGDLVAERIAPADLTARLAALGPRTWERGRNEEVGALYAAYLRALKSLPSAGGIARTDGRDGLTLTAEAIRDRPEEVAARLRQPFGSADAPRTVAIYGLNDLRRGWDRLLDALRVAPFVRELHVYLLLDSIEPPSARHGDADANGFAEPIAEHELLDQLLARKPDHVEPLGRPRGAVGGPLRDPATAPVADRANPLATIGSPLEHVRASLFRDERTAAPFVPHAGVAALAAPDMARELEQVARRIKRLIVDGVGGVPVAPHRIAVVSRKSRPYGDRMAEMLRRHGVPVTSRLRSSLAEVAAVAAFARVFDAAANGYPWRTLADIAECPYFDVRLDVAVLRAASTRGRLTSLGDWEGMLGRLAVQGALEANGDDYRGPSAERAGEALEQFRVFRVVADQFSVSRTRADWISLSLRSLGALPDGVRAPEGREGLWGLCRNACRPPRSERDAVAVDGVRRDIEGLESLRTLLVEWGGSLALDGSGGARLTPAAWAAELRAVLEDTDVTLSTPHRRGVQILEGSAAAWRTFDHVFLLGLTAGEFPSEPQGRELFADHECEALYDALPLEPARVWFAREASLFRQLVNAATRSLHVSHAYADPEGNPQLSSSYFDEIVGSFASSGTPAAEAWPEVMPGSRIAPPSLADAWCEADVALYAANEARRGEAGSADAIAALGHLVAGGDTGALVQRVLRAAQIQFERAELRSAPPPERRLRARRWNGAVDDPALLEQIAARFGDDRVWSASQLEAYGKCPFTFFGRFVLGMRDLEEREEDMDGATRGRLVHAILERLYGALAAEFGDAAMTNDPLVVKRGAKLLHDIVARVMAEAEETGDAGRPELREFRADELERLVWHYVRWEATENEKTSRQAVPRRRPVHNELAFGFGGVPPVRLQRRGRTFLLRGRIDRVDEVIDSGASGWRYIVDHKTGDGALKPVGQYDEGAILQLPLYLHVLERAGEAGAGVWGGAYQILKKGGSRTAHLHPHTLSKGKITEGGSNALTAAGRIGAALDHAVSHIDGIRAGRFPAAIPSCVNACPSYCELRDACREEVAR